MARNPLKFKDKVTIVFAYSGKDKLLKNQLENHLTSILYSENVQDYWVECKSSEQQEEFNDCFAYVENADIFVPLLSASFVRVLANDQHCKFYVNRIKEEQGRKIIPIKLRDVHGWQKILGDIQTLPRGNKPVASASSISKDTAFMEIAEDLEKEIQSYFKYQNKLKEYMKACFEEFQRNNFLDFEELESLVLLQSKLSLNEEDAKLIEKEVKASRGREATKKQKFIGLEFFEGLARYPYEKEPSKFISFWETHRLQLKLAISLILSMLVLGGILSLKPSSESLFREGVESYKKRNYQSAIDSYTQAIEINPEDFNYYNNRGNAYFFQNNYQAAISDYTRAIILNRNNAHGYQYRGEAYLKLGDVEAAVQNFKVAVALHQRENNVDEYQRLMEQLIQLEQQLTKPE